MAKLGGTADPTIVKMAYAAALGNVPGDHSDHYKTMVDTHKELLKGIDEQFKAYQVSKAIDEVAFQTAMSVFDNPLAAQVIDSDYDMMYAEVEAQRQLYEDNKGFKDDDKGLADWNRKNNQIVQRYQGNQQDLVDIKAGVDAKLYDTSTMPKADLNFVTNIANYQGNKNGKSGIYNAKATEYMKANPDATAEQVWNSLGIKDEGVVVKYHDPATGEYTYMSKVTNDDGDTEIVSAKSGELKDKFGQGKKADGALADAEEVYLSVSKQASQTTDSWDKFSNSARNRLETSIDKSMEDNPNTLRYLMHKKVGGQSQTFADALRSGKDGIGLKESIIAGLEGVNSDGDGKLERSDFASGEEGTKNYNKVVNSILNGKLDETNPGATKSMYLDFMDKEFENEHNLRKKVEKPKGGPIDTGEEGGFLTTKKSIEFQGLNRYVKYNTSKTIYDSFEQAIDGKETDFVLAGTTYTYDPEKDNWSDGENDYGNTDRFRRKSLGINDPDFVKLTSGVKELDEGEEVELKKEEPLKIGRAPELGLPGEDGKGNFFVNEDGDSIGATPALFQELEETAVDKVQAMLGDNYIVEEAGWFNRDALKIKRINPPATMAPSSGGGVNWQFETDNYQLARQRAIDFNKVFEQAIREQAKKNKLP
jgi:hypothetical protein